MPTYVGESEIKNLGCVFCTKVSKVYMSKVEAIKSKPCPILNVLSIDYVSKLCSNSSLEGSLEKRKCVSLG